MIGPLETQDMAREIAFDIANANGKLAYITKAPNGWYASDDAYASIPWEITIEIHPVHKAHKIDVSQLNWDLNLGWIA